MLGAIIGDMCGSRYEFNNEKDISKLVMFKEGSFPTDDSIMTVAVARALMDTYGSDDHKIKTALVDAMHYYGHIFPHAGYGGRFTISPPAPEGVGGCLLRKEVIQQLG